MLRQQIRVLKTKIIFGLEKLTSKSSVIFSPESVKPKNFNAAIKQR